MQVSSVSTTQAPDSSAEGDGDTSLMSSDLFAYCQAQMDTIDSEVDGYFNAQQDNNSIQNSLNDALSAVEGLQQQATANGGTTNDATAVNSIEQTLQGIASEYPAGATQIQNAINTLTTNGQGGTDTIVSSSDCASIINTLTDVSTQLGSDNQMDMINLQSAMSDREQAIELTSNILQAVDDSANKVIANIQS
ncbi:MAG TPA: hypothetical protein VEK07_04610 [Polyangiaceae bacterium]|nr:hypothetical protein [Polyangiaceae bacterium]